jgi:hypothetical protein
VGLDLQRISDGKDIALGWVSMNEDIEEIRNQRAHFKNGITNIVSKLKKGSTPKDLARSEGQIKDVTDMRTARSTLGPTMTKAFATDEPL